MLLTAPLAPALVSGCFLIAGAAALFLIAERAAPGSLWPWTAATLYFGLQVCITDRIFTAWGELEKLHELTAVMTLGLLWCVVSLPQQDKQRQRLWGITIALILLAQVLITNAIAIMSLLVLGLVATWWWVTARRHEAIIIVLAGSACCVGLACLFVINYLFTGIPDDHFIVSLWPYLDLHKMLKGGNLFEILLSHARRSFASPEPLPEFMASFFFFLRLNMLYPLFISAVWPR